MVTSLLSQSHGCWRPSPPPPLFRRPRPIGRRAASHYHRCGCDPPMPHTRPGLRGRPQAAGILVPTFSVALSWRANCTQSAAWHVAGSSGPRLGYTPMIYAPYGRSAARGAAVAGTASPALGKGSFPAALSSPRRVAVSSHTPESPAAPGRPAQDMSPPPQQCA